MANSISTLFSAYASFAAFTMMVRTMMNEVIPDEFRSHITSLFRYYFSPFSPTLTLIVDEFSGMTRNQVYDAASIYLPTRISPSTGRLRIRKTPREKQISVAMEKGELITDEFEGMKLEWQYVCEEPKISYRCETKQFELSFNKKCKDKMMNSYLPYVLQRASEIKMEQKEIKLYNRECPNDDEDGSGGGIWGSVNFEHPSTFETIAMDPELKKTIVEDLDRFLRRREFYKRVGKAWKRGYLLYGPPGTGKSSLIAAMANYLKFDIYDLELTSISNNSDLRKILLTTTNRSILVIEDIDCSVEMRDRQGTNESCDNKLTLSGVLNFVDGLWSSCGDERIIILTTNHKDKLDPALLRPGRMDMHINMCYCTVPGFHVLASNYLGIDSRTHRLSGEFESLVDTTDVTPAEIAEELMKNEDSDVVMEGVLKFLKRKNSEANQVKTEEKCSEEHEEKRQKCDYDDDDKNVCCIGRKNSSKPAKKGKRKKKTMYS